MSNALLKPPGFRLDRRHYIAIGLVILVATPLVAYYFMSYNSVNGTVVELVTGRRSYSTFYIEVHVWSWGASLATRVLDPKFSLAVDNFPLGVQDGLSGAFAPHGYLTYNLAFVNTDSALYTIFIARTNSVVITMSGTASSGMYQEQVTKSDSASWTWSS